MPLRKTGAEPLIGVLGAVVKADGAARPSRIFRLGSCARIQEAEI